MSRLAYTVFVAFVSSLLTLVAVWMLMPAPRPEADRIDPGEAPLRQITMAELAEHDSRDSCWKAIEGRVYDVTEYIPEHPTSERVLLRWCGRESTEAWKDKGGGRPHSTAARAELEQYLIGELAGDGETGPSR